MFNFNRHCRFLPPLLVFPSQTHLCITSFLLLCCCFQTPTPPLLLFHIIPTVVFSRPLLMFPFLPCRCLHPTPLHFSLSLFPSKLCGCFARFISPVLLFSYHPTAVSFATLLLFPHTATAVFRKLLLLMFPFHPHLYCSFPDIPVIFPHSFQPSPRCCFRTPTFHLTSTVVILLIFLSTSSAAPSRPE